MDGCSTFLWQQAISLFCRLWNWNVCVCRSSEPLSAMYWCSLGTLAGWIQVGGSADLMIPPAELMMAAGEVKKTRTQTCVSIKCLLLLRKTCNQLKPNHQVPVKWSALCRNDHFMRHVISVHLIIVSLTRHAVLLLFTVAHISTVPSLHHWLVKSTHQ